MTLHRMPLVLLLLTGCKIGETQAIQPGDGDPLGLDDGSADGPDGSPGPGDGDTGDGDTGDGDMGDGDTGDGDTGDGDAPDGGDDPAPDGGPSGDGDAEDAGDDPPLVTPCGGDGAPCVPPAGCSAMDQDGHTYFFCPDLKVWADARAACHAAGTDLAIIDSEAENAFVAGQLPSDSWIGLNDLETEGNMVWIVPGSAALSGSVPAITPPWDGSTGNDNCTQIGINLGEQDCMMLTKGGLWNDHGCNAGDCAPGLGADTYGGHRAYVCESF